MRGLPVHGLRLLARLLPRDFRERVFEPAFDDYLLDGLETPDEGLWRAPGRVMRGLILVFESLRLALPRYFWWQGRLTRVGVVLIGLLIVVTALIVWSGMFARYPTSP